MIRYLETFFRNRWIISIPAILLLCSGVALIFIQPLEFTASATIWAETSAYLDVQLSKNPYATPGQIQASRFDEFVSTYSFARAIVDQTSIGKQGTEHTKDLLVDALHKGLLISNAGDHTIRVRFTYPDPNIALTVVQHAIDQFNKVTAESVTSQASDAIAFYQQQVKQYEDNVLPRSKANVSNYLAAHPEVRRNLATGGPPDPGFALVQQQFESDREQYDRLIGKLEEVQTQSMAASRNQELTFRTVDRPGLLEPNGVRYTKKKLVMFAGIGVGLSGGYTLLFLLLATELDRTLRNPSDVRRKLQLPTLEVIPDYNKRLRFARFRRSKRRQQQRIASAQPSSSI